MSLRDRVNELPEIPGVYCFYDVNRNPAYVGKSSNIKERLKQHLIKQDSSISSYGKLDLWDVYYVHYWGTENYNFVENELINYFEPYLNLEKIENIELSIDPKNPSGKLKVISKEEAEFRRLSYNRIKQKMDHLERMVDKIKMADHTKDTQKILYKHLEQLESSLDEFLDIDKN